MFNKFSAYGTEATLINEIVYHDGPADDTIIIFVWMMNLLKHIQRNITSNYRKLHPKNFGD